MSVWQQVDVDSTPSFPECCLCGLSWRRSTGGCLSVLPTQTGAWSHWTGSSFVCSPARHTTNTRAGAALRSDVCHTSLSVCCLGFFSDRVTILDRPVTQRSWMVCLKGIHNLVSDSQRNADEKVYLEKSMSWFFCHNICWGLLQLRRWHKCALL